MAIWHKDQRNYYKRTGGALGKKPTSRAERDAARRERDAARAARGPAGQAGSGTQEPQSVAATQQDPQPTPGAQTTSMASSRKTNPWGATAVPSSYKPGTNAPRFFSHQPTETREDMEERHDAISRWLDDFRTLNNESAPESRASAPSDAGSTLAPRGAASSTSSFDQDLSEVLAAVGSHGTVEASQRGMYSGRTVQPASEKLGGGLTDRQKEGVDRSVRAEIGARLEAKQTGAAYTGAHSAEEQRRQNLDYQNALVERFGETEAKERLGDRWVDAGPPPSGENEDEPAFGAMADAKGGKTSAPGPVPIDTSAPPEPEEPQLVFGSRGEAASALMSRGAEMDYPTFAQAAAVASLPGPGDGPDYDPDASFAELVTGRISDELLSLAERVEAYDAEREDAYHASNAAAVAMAAGVSPEVYANAAPDERLYLQEKFMDSF